MKVHGNTRHGHAQRSGRSPTWLAWASMIRRCTLPSQDSYPLYGGRGIKVCQRWLSSFEAFLDDMGEKPAGMTLERKDVNGHYEPANCRWATQAEQSVNKRTTRLIAHNGESLSAAEWAARTGLPSAVIRSRIDRLGWTVERALTEPLVPEEVSVRRAATMQPRAPVDAYLIALRQGASCADVALQHGVSTSAVAKALRRRGLSVGDFTQTTEARRARASVRKSPPPRKPEGPDAIVSVAAGP